LIFDIAIDIDIDIDVGIWNLSFGI